MTPLEMHLEVQELKKRLHEGKITFSQFKQALDRILTP